MFQKNDLIELTIRDMGTNGEGIGTTDGFTFFVKDAVPGDRIRAKVLKLKKTYGYARMEEILEPSRDRVEAVCPVARQCGGCSLQEMAYSAQLRFKENLVRNDLIRIGGFREDLLDACMEPIIGAKDFFRYRNKMQFPIGCVKSKDGSLSYAAGFYAARTHSLIPVADCMLGFPENREITSRILKWMEQEENRPYDEESGRGCIRHLLIRKGFRTGEILVCLVINEPIQGGEALRDALFDIPGMTSVSLNFNQEKTNVILGEKTVTLWGKPSITEEIGGIRFEISPKSFFQVNPFQTEKLYSKALEYADLTGKETVWDLFCGTGTISLFLAKRAKTVYGVEIIPQAIEDARRNAAANGIENAEFFVGKAEEKFLPGKPDVVVLDPPRKGCEEKLLRRIMELAPKRIVYVSCDPATLSRDLRILCGEEYELREAAPVDMFPMTRHVETVALLSKLSEAKHHIEVKVDMDELDLTSAEAKATYKEIQDWVQEKYGFHVTNLNIAQVKQKHGIIERENYNKPKSEDSKQPGCPEEKVKAIEDAMRHFQMI